MQQAKQISRIHRKDKADILDEHVAVNRQRGDKRNKTKRGFATKRIWADIDQGSRKLI